MNKERFRLRTLPEAAEEIRSETAVRLIDALAEIISRAAELPEFAPTKPQMTKLAHELRALRRTATAESE